MNLIDQNKNMYVAFEQDLEYKQELLCNQKHRVHTFKEHLKINSNFFNEWMNKSMNDLLCLYPQLKSENLVKSQ